MLHEINEELTFFTMRFWTHRWITSTYKRFTIDYYYYYYYYYYCYMLCDVIKHCVALQSLHNRMYRYKHQSCIRSITNLAWCLWRLWSDDFCCICVRCKWLWQHEHCAISYIVRDYIITFSIYSIGRYVTFLRLTLDGTVLAESVQQSCYII